MLNATQFAPHDPKSDPKSPNPPGAPATRDEEYEPTVRIPVLPAHGLDVPELSLEDTMLRRAPFSGYNPYEKDAPAPPRRKPRLP